MHSGEGSKGSFCMSSRRIPLKLQPPFLVHSLTHHYRLLTTKSDAMLYLRVAAFTLAILTTPMFALPASESPSLASRADTETWSIPNMELHMMTRHSGLPGDGAWPEYTKYPSTIDFDINMPNNRILHCHNSFVNGTLPDDLAACSGEGDRVRFRMVEYTELGPRRKELSFVLEVFRVQRRR